MIYVLIHDKGEEKYVRTFYEFDEKFFQQENKKGWGAYFAVNDFEATEEEMKAIGKKTKRNIPFLKKINHVFADLDIAKSGDGQTREQKEEKKEMLMFELYDICPPSKVIGTSNGIQPLWELIDCGIDEESQRRYVALINGIIAWSKTKGAAGDEVKDVTRVLRLPNYYHMKEEPFLCKVIAEESFKYRLEDLEKTFKDFIKAEKVQTWEKPMSRKLDDLSLAIDRLDIQDVAKKAFSSIGRSCEFDKQGRIILDGRLSGNFQGKNGDRQYLASTSHEAFTGNKITATADIKQITNKEARAWIIDEFNLRKEVIKKKNEPVEKRELTNYYSWGTQGLTDSIAPIKRTTYSIIGGGYGVGKTPFCLNLALANAKMGHKVLYLSLEMDTDEILDFLGRKAAGITIPEENNKTIPEYKQIIYEKKKAELLNNQNFVLRGVRKGIAVNWDILCGFMDGEWDLIIVDNFNLIRRHEKVTQYDHEGWLSKQFLAYTEEKQTPVVAVHHYSKGGARETKKTGYSLSGNAEIMNDAQRLLLLERRRFEFDDEPTDEERAEMRVFIDKGRSYDSGFTKIVYFKGGVFVDEFEEKKPPDCWQSNF